MQSERPIEALRAATLPLLIAPRDEQAIAIARGVAALTLGLAGARLLLYGPGHAIGWILAAAALGFAAIPTVLRRTGDRRLAGSLMPVIGLAALTAMTAVEGGLSSEATYWLPMVPVLAAVTRGPGRATLGFAAYALGLVGALTVAQGLGLHPDAPVEPLPALLLRGGGLAGAVGSGAVVAWALEQAWANAANTIVSQAANHPVTGLPSRLAFDRELRAAIARGERADEQVAVAYIDLDRFKRVNDRLGHSAGDALLREVARRLRDATRTGETPFHLAGDEFAVVLERVAPWEVDAPAERLATVLRGVPAGPMKVDASVGIALGAPGESAASLVARADHAMYAAKEAGGGMSAPASSGAWQWVPEDDLETSSG